MLYSATNLSHSSPILKTWQSINTIWFTTTLCEHYLISAKIEGEAFFEKVPGLCQAVGSICTVSCVTSLMTIGILSINRYVCICAHEKYERMFTKCNSICMCITPYFIGGILVLLNMAGIGDHGFNRKSLDCIWDRMATYIYTVFFSITLVWIPAVIIGVCYFKIYLYVRAHRSRMREQDHGGNSQSFKRLNLAKTFFIIYAVFITCWAPYAILMVVDMHDAFSQEVHIYITAFAHLHPSLNCLVYYFTNKKFESAYKQLFGSCIFSQINDGVFSGVIASKSNMVVPYTKPTSSDKQFSDSCSRHEVTGSRMNQPLELSVQPGIIFETNC